MTSSSSWAYDPAAIRAPVFVVFGDYDTPVYVILTNQPQNHFPNEVVGSVGYQ